jgi:glycine/D-amino acid oxidase-like deaminating enzyme
MAPSASSTIKFSSSRDDSSYNSDDDHGDSSSSSSNVVLRSELYRLALSEQQAAQLQRSAALLPNGTATYFSDSELQTTDIRNATFGALKLHNGGCLVVHVPSYLRGLWRHCQLQQQQQRNEQDPRVVVEWHTDRENVPPTDISIYCAGSGMLDGSGALRLEEAKHPVVLPVQLVRGQSLEIPDRPQRHALLCGKYMSPLPENKTLIGATHEWQTEPLSKEDVIAELKERTRQFVDWEGDGSLDLSPPPSVRVTSGYRVQTARGANGRMPIVGRLSETEWVFTGLSGRGLLYHALYADILTDAIRLDSEEAMLQRHEGLLWWKEAHTGKYAGPNAQK